MLNWYKQALLRVLCAVVIISSAIPEDWILPLQTVI